MVTELIIITTVGPFVAFLLGVLVGRIISRIKTLENELAELKSLKKQKELFDPKDEEKNEIKENIIRTPHPSKSSVMKYKTPQEVRKERDERAMDEQIKSIAEDDRPKGAIVL